MLNHYSIIGTGKATDLCKIIEKYSKSAKKMKKCAKRKKPPLSKGGGRSEADGGIPTGLAGLPVTSANGQESLRLTAFGTSL